MTAGIPATFCSTIKTGSSRYELRTAKVIGGEVCSLWLPCWSWAFKGLLSSWNLIRTCKIKWNRCCKNWQKFTKTCSASVKMPCNNMLIAKNMINSGRGIGMREALITIAIIVIRGLHCCVVECETMTWTCATEWSKPRRRRWTLFVNVTDECL